MARKKTVEVEPEVVDVTSAAPETEEPAAWEMVWVETVDELGRRMIQVPKKG